MTSIHFKPKRQAVGGVTPGSHVPGTHMALGRTLSNISHPSIFAVGQLDGQPHRNRA